MDRVRWIEPEKQNAQLKSRAQGDTDRNDVNYLSLT